MGILLWTVLPAPWKYGAVVAPFASFYAVRWLMLRRRR